MNGERNIAFAESATNFHERARSQGVNWVNFDWNKQEDTRVNYLRKALRKTRECMRGQTMTEYVLIIAAVAVAGYVAYQGLEGGINTIITSVTNTLKGA